MDLSQQIGLYVRYVEDTLGKWTQSLKYDEDVEYFIRELRNIFDRHQISLQFENKGIEILWDTKEKTT
jgi:hypothetical protein